MTALATLLLSLRNRSLPFAEIALTAVLASALIVAAFQFGNSKVEASKSWVETVQLKYEGLREKDLFEAIVRYRLLSFDKDNSQQLILRTRLEVRATDSLSNTKDNPALAYSFEGAQKMLWRSTGPGRTIRRAVERYNASHSQIAVRHSDISLLPCAAQIEAPAWSGRDLLPSPCLPPEWRAELNAPSSDLSAPDAAGSLPSVLAKPSAAPPGPDFDQMARFGTGLMSAWAGFQFSSAPWASLRFSLRSAGSTRADPQSRYQLDIVGSDIILDDSLTAASDVVSFCRSPTLSRSLSRCDDGSAHGRMVAKRVTLPIGALAEGMSFQLKPVSRRRYTLRDGARLELNNRIALNCTAEVCTPSWIGRPIEANIAPTQTPTPNVLIDPVDDAPTEPTPEHEAKALISKLNFGEYIDALPNGFLTYSAKAQELGLGMQLGGSSNHPNTVLEFLRNAPGSVDLSDLDLTIDPTVQAAAQKALLGARQERAWLPQKYDGVRQSAIVVLDISDPQNAGNILAAVSTPTGPSLLSDWDLEMLSRNVAGRSQIESGAWSALGQSFTAGSVVKPLVGLSLIDSAIGANQGPTATERETIARALAGETDSFYREKIGFDPQAMVQKVPHNFDNPEAKTLDLSDSSQFSLSRRAVALATSCQNSSSQGPLGLCAATASSSNIWFGIMNRLGNQRASDTLSGRAQDPVFPTFAQTAVRLGFNDPKRLISLPNAVAQVVAQPGPRMTRIQIGSAPGLFLNKPQALAAPRDAQADLFITLNGYGQAVQTTPLAIGKMMASIALNTRVDPRLIVSRSQGPQPIGAPLYPAGSPGAPYYDLLVQGLSAVLTSPTGTGHETFAVAPKLRTRVFGKTGTATINGPGGVETDPKLYTSWFAGWANAPGTNKPQIAFACAISHVQNSAEPNSSTQLCARTIARFLTTQTKEPRGGTERTGSSLRPVPRPAR